MIKQKQKRYTRIVVWVIPRAMIKQPDCCLIKNLSTGGGVGKEYSDT